jgi:hypothetical protein
MSRTLIILCLALVVAAGAAAADETAPVVAVASAEHSAAAEPSATPASHGAKPRAKKADAAKPAETTAEAVKPGGDVKMSGMSILGNEDSPKSLVLVPWKSSQLGEMPSVSRLLDSSTQPVDKDVFLRELAYYEFRSGSK